jgi:SAM-dependent methyltransferase
VSGMDVTNRFVLDFARSFARKHPGSRILDFGCGAGALVDAGMAAGLPVCGADTFYAGAEARPRGGAVYEILDGVLPFADASFGLVVNNQVMEHVEDLDAVLREIHRVLAPGGQVLSVFPSRDVFREGHIGIPFSHWFRPGSRIRFLYAWGLRALGFGTWKEQAPTARQWAMDKLRWIDLYTRYRSRREIFETYGRYFRSETRELDYIRYRLLDRPGRGWIASALGFAVVGWAARAMFRKLAFFVILSRKAAL